MSFQEKSSWVSIFSSAAVYIGYLLFILSKISGGTFNPETDFKYWAIVVLILIPVQIVANIVFHILFSIGNAVATQSGEDIPEEVKDERDVIIDLKASRVGYNIVGAGFLISLLSLILGFPVFYMFNIVFLFFSLGEIIGSILKLRYYKRGF